MLRGSAKTVVGVGVALLTPLVLFFTTLSFAPASAVARPSLTPRDLGVIHDDALPPPPPAVTTTTTMVPIPDPSDLSPGWEQRWGQAALARIKYPWQQFGYSVTFLSGRPGLLAKTDPKAHTITVYVRQGETFDRMMHAVAHEIGHVVDLAYNDAGRRAQWRQLRGIDPSLSWFLWSGRDYGSPAGDFAETFAYWQAGPSDYSDWGPPKDLGPLLPLFYATP